MYKQIKITLMALAFMCVAFTTKYTAFAGTFYEFTFETGSCMYQNEKFDSEVLVYPYGDDMYFAVIATEIPSSYGQIFNHGWNSSTCSQPRQNIMKLVYAQTLSDVQAFVGCSNKFVAPLVSATENVLFFNSAENAFNAVMTGNFVSDGPSEYDTSKLDVFHDFSKDTYTSEMPIPELSQITHEGLYIENPDNYNVDIIIKKTIYGVGFGDGHCSVNKEWAWTSKTYNMTVHDLGYNEGGYFDIKEKYHINFDKDFQPLLDKWNSTYPSVKELPGYSFKYIFYGSSYDSYIGNSVAETYGAHKAFAYQGRLKTEYYVRLFDNNFRYSQWVKASYGPGATPDAIGGSMGDKEDFTLGLVDSFDKNGNPISSNEQKYIYDMHNGSYSDTDTFYSSGSGNTNTNIGDPGSREQTMNIESVVSTMGTLRDLLGEFPYLIDYVFVFLPGWCRAIMGLTISLSCVIGLVSFIRG